LAEHALPVRQFGLLVRSIDKGKLTWNAVRVVGVFSAALGSAPGVFGVVDRAQLDVFAGGFCCRNGRLLRPSGSGRENEQGCERESCMGHAAILAYAAGFHQNLRAVSYSHPCVRI